MLLVLGIAQFSNGITSIIGIPRLLLLEVSTKIPSSMIASAILGLISVSYLFRALTASTAFLTTIAPVVFPPTLLKISHSPGVCGWFGGGVMSIPIMALASFSIGSTAMVAPASSSICLSKWASIAALFITLTTMLVSKWVK